MKTELQTKFLQNVVHKGAPNQGFTLIELLVVIVIIGVLSAITLPSFLSMASKSRQAEAKTYVSAINRSQQAYFLEKDTFGGLSDLEVGISSSRNYIYTSVPSGSGFTAVALTTATPTAIVMRGYVGRVWIGLTGNGNVATFSIVCEGDVGVVPVVTGAECP